MFRKRKMKSQNSDFVPECNHSKEYHEIVERDTEGYKVVCIQCEMCDTYGRRPVGFVFPDEDDMPIPDFDTLTEDSETELYYKLNFLLHAFPNKVTQSVIAKTKHELKTRFDALKYDIPNEGTLNHWRKSERIKQKFLAGRPEN